MTARPGQISNASPVQRPIPGAGRRCHASRALSKLRRPRLRLLRGLWPHPAGGRFLWSSLGGPACRRISRHGRGRKNWYLLRFAGSRQGCLRHGTAIRRTWDSGEFRAHAEKFSAASFQRRIRQVVAEEAASTFHALADVLIDPSNMMKTFVPPSSRKVRLLLMTSIPGYKQLCQLTRRPHGPSPVANDSGIVPTARRGRKHLRHTRHAEVARSHLVEPTTRVACKLLICFRTLPGRPPRCRQRTGGERRSGRKSPEASRPIAFAPRLGLHLRSPARLVFRQQHGCGICR